MDGLIGAPPEGTDKLFAYYTDTTLVNVDGTAYANSKKNVSETYDSFWNKDSTLIGFKDKKGVVKIEPKFQNFTAEAIFEGIIAVNEENDGSWQNYYLTKSGRIVGRDSMYFFDNGEDCESEVNEGKPR